MKSPSLKTSVLDPSIHENMYNNRNNNVNVLICERQSVDLNKRNTHHSSPENSVPPSVRDPVASAPPIIHKILENVLKSYITHQFPQIFLNYI